MSQQYTQDPVKNRASAEEQRSVEEPRPANGTLSPTRGFNDPPKQLIAVEVSPLSDAASAVLRRCNSL